MLFNNKALILFVGLILFLSATIISYGFQNENVSTEKIESEYTSVRVIDFEDGSNKIFYGKDVWEKDYNELGLEVEN